MKATPLRAALFALPFSCAAAASLTLAQSPQTPKAGLTDAVVLRLLGNAGKPREGLRAGRRVSVPDVDDNAWAVELLWSEAGRERTGVALIGPLAISPGGRWAAKEGTWGLISVDEDATWAKLLAVRQEAEISNNEHRVSSSLQTFSSYAVAFESSNAGLPPSVTCLVRPQSCVPDSKDVALEEEWLQPERGGYRFTFHAGPTQGRWVKSFALTAIPINVGVTGRRAFCLDQTGRICAADDGKLAPVRGGACPSNCQELK